MKGYKTGDDFQAGSSFLSEPGCYHMVIAYVRDPAANKEGKPIAGGLFTVGFSVLAGGNGEQVGKATEITFFGPNTDHKDGGKFSRKKIDRFLLATGVVGPDQKNCDVDYDLTKLAGRQLCMQLEKSTSKGKDGKEHDRLEIHYADIYHVDDADVATWERDPALLALIPAKLRRAPKKRGAAKTAESATPPAVVVDSLDI